MADYTEEQRVKQKYPDAYAQWSHVTHEYVVWSGAVSLETRLGWGFSTADAWADASRRLGNEFVDEVGPLAERKEG